MRQIGSQIRETLDESQYTVIAFNYRGEVFLRSGNSPLELWSSNDNYAGYVVEVAGVGYEFVRKATANDVHGAIMPDMQVVNRKTAQELVK